MKALKGVRTRIATRAWCQENPMLGWGWLYRLYQRVETAVCDRTVTFRRHLP